LLLLLLKRRKVLQETQSLAKALKVRRMPRPPGWTPDSYQYFYHAGDHVWTGRRRGGMLVSRLLVRVMIAVFPQAKSFAMDKIERMNEASIVFFLNNVLGQRNVPGSAPYPVDMSFGDSCIAAYLAGNN
jgi:hypothetical protein